MSALDGLSDIRRLRDLLDQAELAAVRAARRRGASWAEIATRLGVTRQSAWERWRDLDESAQGAEPSPEAPVEAAVAADLVAQAVESRRRSTVKVPDVVGLSFEQARNVLEDKRLLALPVESGGVPVVAERGSSAVVTDQSPESGARVAAGTRITLWLGRGGSAGVREPRRPSPDPRTLRGMRDEPWDEALG